MGDLHGCFVLPTSGGPRTHCVGNHSPRPTLTSAPNRIMAIGAAGPVDVGYYGACGIDTTSGTPQAFCWGSSLGSRFGVGASRSPHIINRPAAEAHTAVGGFHLCVLEAGAVYCDGENTSGQLGTGSFAPATGFPAVGGALGTVVQLTATERTTCALIDDGTVKCWGDGAYGRLGNGSTEDVHTPVQVPGLFNVIDFDFGWRHICAIEAADPGDTSGTVFCWGYNGAGAVGSTAMSVSTTPLSTGITDAVAVTGGEGHSCAVRVGGEVVCWGDGRQHQLGDGGPRENMRAQTTIPGFVANTTTPLIDAGEQGARTTCALSDVGNVYCWGECLDGACAIGELFSATPMPVVP